MSKPFVLRTDKNKDGSIEVSVNPNINKLDFSIVDLSSEDIPIVGIKNVDQIREISGLSEDNFKLKWIRYNTWPIQTRSDKFGGTSKKATVVLARQARATFEPTKDIESGTEDLISRLENVSPKVNKIDVSVNTFKIKDNLLEITIPDLHYGMHIWGEEGGYTEYNFDIAENLFLGSIHRLIEQAMFHGFEEIVFPIGNDFLHIDNSLNQTTKGTHQPDALSWHLSFEKGRDLLIKAIDYMKYFAPVHVIAVPGNHDFNSMIHMSYVIDAYYRNDENVTVTAGPQPIRYKEYGVNLIGFDHGKNVAPARMAGLMAEDNPEAWARTKFRAWHLGDKHRSGRAWFAEHSVDIEYIPSLAGINAWSRSKSFSWMRSANAYLWNKRFGPIAKLQINVDPANPESLLGV